jgi:metallophosphoesterase superfamily enzyme
MANKLTRFAFICDLHYGYQRVGGHKVPLHDLKAFGAALAFLQDFKPDLLILGGDILDCGIVSHHNHGKPGRTEGLKLLADAQDCVVQVMKPLLALKAKEQVFIEGNHEKWLKDLVDMEPGLEGIVDLKKLLNLDNHWQVVAQGKRFDKGKLTFLHGDQISGGEHVAKSAVTSYERSIRFGHHHTFQTFTKTSPIDVKLGKTGIAVPCLCQKDQPYLKGKANRWVQGLLTGYLSPDGSYADYVSVITDGKLIAPNGHIYRG